VATTWTNWAGDQRCAPVQLSRPGSEAEVAELVARAAARGLPVRAAGAGHSFTDCACTDGVLVDTGGLQRVLAVDRASGLVTVEGGIRLRRLGEELARHGLGLENQGDIDAQALAGALATATHGTGLRFANLSAQVAGMRLVTATGEVLDLREETDAEALLAARVGVGALGIVTAVTLRAIPLYTLHRRDAPQPLDEVLERLDELAETHDHFEFYVFPYTRTALARETRRSSEPPDPPPAWRKRLTEDVLENRALALVCRTGRAVPRAVPRLNRLMAASLPGGWTVDHAYRVYASRREVRFNEMEYAIPRAAAREAVERVLETFERRRLPVVFPLEVRFSAGDDAFLSTAHGRETAYVAVHQFHGMDHETPFRAVEAIMDELGGRPHWGKRHYQVAATLRERYPGWDRWQAVRARLDPGGTFTNDYVRRTLGAVAA